MILSEGGKMRLGERWREWERGEWDHGKLRPMRFGDRAHLGMHKTESIWLVVGDVGRIVDRNMAVGPGISLLEVQPSCFAVLRQRTGVRFAHHVVFEEAYKTRIHSGKRGKWDHERKENAYIVKYMLGRGSRLDKSEDSVSINKAIRAERIKNNWL